MSTRGRLIVFEGLDRSGKSTQCLRLQEHLQKQGRRVQVVRFPDRTEAFGRVIDAYLRKEIDIASRQALHLAFSLNRWEKADTIRQWLAEDVDVLCDRYCYSGVAYSLAQGLDEHWTRQADIGLPLPDLVLLFQVSTEVARVRGGFGDERLESEQLQAKVGERLKELVQPDWILIDGAGDLDAVSARVHAAVASRPAASGPIGSIVSL